MKFFRLIIFLFCAALSGSSIQEEATQRWQIFETRRHFQPFIVGRSDAELKEEFENIDADRRQIWTTRGYERAENLLASDLVRAPGCAAFAYNNTVPYYNASTLYIGDKSYIACEGPRSKDIPKFFKMLETLHVTHLVRLTDSYEGESKKCHPYWEGLTSKGENSLNIPTETGLYTIRSFNIAHWRDHSGFNPNELLSLAFQVRKELADCNGLLAVHCSAGVGRTGTFLAALAIIDAIDQKKPFSIEEIVYRLSLQRVHTVAKYCQYITLHRMAESYLKKE